MGEKKTVGELFFELANGVKVEIPAVPFREIRSGSSSVQINWTKHDAGYRIFVHFSTREWSGVKPRMRFASLFLNDSDGKLATSGTINRPDDGNPKARAQLYVSSPGNYTLEVVSQ